MPMMLHKIIESPQLQKAAQALRVGDSLLVEQLWNAPKAAIASLAQQVTGKPILILTGAGIEEMRLFHDFPQFTNRPIVDFPAWETLPSENVAPSPDIVGERYRTLKEVSATSEPYIVISSLQACLQKILPRGDFLALYMTLKVGDSISREVLLDRLEEMGYHRCSVAADKGEYAVRGGIIDIFPVSSPAPCRIEFFADEIESMRIYDPIGQRSIRDATSVDIPPARELEFLGKGQQLTTLLEYLGPDTLIIFDDIVSLEDKYASLIAISGTSTPHFCSLSEFLDLMKPLQKIFFATEPIETLGKVEILDAKQGNYYSTTAPLVKLSFEIFNRTFIAERFRHPFLTLQEFLVPHVGEISTHELLKGVSARAKEPLQLHFLCNGAPEEEGLQKRIHDENISLPAGTEFHMGYLSSGFALPETNLVLFPVTELTGRHKIRRQQQRTTFHTLPTEAFDLVPGDIVVHFNFGIGKYLGLEKKTSHAGVTGEFLIVEYAEGSKIYVPLSQAHLVTKYIGASEDIMPLHTIGGSRWQKTRDRTIVAIEGYATDLLDLYAKRQMAGGHACGVDSPQYVEFEDDFPYIETEDQLAAIAAIKDDMTSSRCMDRLVCGDVGYGKTEVAMRAAFKAVVDGGKQVAVLVPTTVLAMQHYESFVERMCNFPVTIGVLSRFRTAKQVRQTIVGVAAGSVDIVIGTHRLISKDVTFKDLGLIIIDEEQRFGVKAKEYLKKIKTGVDCLTLSATPIPRTLYMSLIGARDLSVINTPPQDRLPITTIVADTSEAIFRTAIARELARDGQVFVIHNRVETSYEVATRLKKLFPMATVDVCHGQMDSDEIDLTFHRFKSGATQILIATTIVENGIDIPNANTILIDKADHFGLADLYQLRGRVGRWNRRAYAYLLVRNLQSLPEIARKRLHALAESSGYGGGMKIARHDLEIRGAGNILGTEQSGQVAAIGFHLYCKMLKKTILRLQGKGSKSYTDPKIDFPVDARLPEDYVPEINLRVEICQRFGEAASLEEVDAIWSELKDRFGTPPLPAEWLYRLVRIKLAASESGILALKFERNILTIERKQGKASTIHKHPMLLPKKPQELESKILKLL
jgi:transcription-repair coupling factor (superfamily II helicase)